jgi:penicillin-binding protein 1A
MREHGVVSDSEIATALTSPQVRAKSYWTGSENYVADLVMKRLPDLVGTVTEDLVVDTTIDFQLQREAEKACARGLGGQWCEVAGQPGRAGFH